MVRTFNFKDIIGIFILIFILDAISFLVLQHLFSNSRYLEYLWSFITSLIAIFVILFWTIKLKRLKKEVLGLKKGKWGLKIKILYGVIGGFFVFFIPSMFLGFQDIVYLQFTFKWLIWTLLSPFTLAGFTLMILVPLKEELLFRGVLYNYLRFRMGIFPGLFIQAIIFSFAHLLNLNYIKQGIVTHVIIQQFFNGLILGYLYEVSDSLYPSIIFHGTSGFLWISFAILRR